MQYILIKELDDFDEYIKALSWLKKDEELKIIINSHWWDITIKDFLSKELKEFNYSIQVYKALSAWLTLLYELKDKATSIYISDSAILMAHIGAWNIDLWAWLQPRWDFARYQKEMQEEYIDITYDFLTEEQAKMFLNWDDVYIKPKQLKEYLNK